MTPAPKDLENEAYRREVARVATEHLERAIAACGPGKQAYGRRTLQDSTGGPDRIVYCALEEGSGWRPTIEEAFGGALDEPHPTKTLRMFDGREVPAPRYIAYWSCIDIYHPKTAEQLAEAREKRLARREEKFRQDNPLLALMDAPTTPAEEPPR